MTVVLQSGKVLLAGGDNPTSGGGDLTTTYLYDPVANTWSSGGSMANGRSTDAAATLLPNGQVLASGGPWSGTGLRLCELYDPATNAWSLTGSMIAGREYHTATLLPSGLVLAAAGGYDENTATAELYDPSTGAWTATASLATARAEHTATLFANGDVLAVGGEDANGDALDTAELYSGSSTTATTCTMASQCATGFCVDGYCCNSACGGGVTTDCQACNVTGAEGTCSPQTGTSCSNGDACTLGDTCQAGTCMAGTPVVCQPLDTCHVAGTCDPTSGLCSNPAKANGAACDDGNFCTQTDACQNGFCVGFGPDCLPALRRLPHRRHLQPADGRVLEPRGSGRHRLPRRDLPERELRPVVELVELQQQQLVFQHELFQHELVFQHQLVLQHQRVLQHRLVHHQQLGRGRRHEHEQLDERRDGRERDQQQRRDERWGGRRGGRRRPGIEGRVRGRGLHGRRRDAGVGGARGAAGREAAQGAGRLDGARERGYENAVTRPPRRGPYRADQIAEGSPYELSNGHRIHCMTTGRRGGRANLVGGEVLETDPAVAAAGVDVGFSNDPNHLRAPDVSVGDFANEPGWDPNAPPLAVEYADTGQDEAELKKKIAELLAAGTKHVWVVRLTGPRRVEIHERGRKVRLAKPGDALLAPGILKNPVPVAALYDRDAAHEATLRNLLQRRGYEDLDAVISKGVAQGKIEGKIEGKIRGQDSRRAARFSSPCSGRGGSPSRRSSGHASSGRTTASASIDGL